MCVRFVEKLRKKVNQINKLKGVVYCIQILGLFTIKETNRRGTKTYRGSKKKKTEEEYFSV